MAANKDDMGPLFGIRRDVDLTKYWWHRLFKVVYIVMFGIALAIAGWVMISGEYALEYERNEVVSVSLGQHLAARGESQFTLADLRGRLARDGQTFEP